MHCKESKTLATVCICCVHSDHLLEHARGARVDAPGRRVGAGREPGVLDGPWATTADRRPHRGGQVHTVSHTVQLRGARDAHPAVRGPRRWTGFGFFWFFLYIFFVVYYYYSVGTLCQLIAKKSILVENKNWSKNHIFKVEP